MATVRNDGKARLAVDIGGTFTDLALEHAGGMATAKVLTTPRAPEQGVMEGVEAILSRSDAFVTNAAEKLFTYALGRPLQYFDKPTVRAVVRKAAPSDYRFSSLVLGVVTSDAFQMKMKKMNIILQRKNGMIMMIHLVINKLIKLKDLFLMKKNKEYFNGYQGS